MIDNIFDPYMVLAVSILIGVCCCYKHAKHLSHIENLHLKSSLLMCETNDDRLRWDAIDEAFTRLTLYYNNVKETLIDSGLTPVHVNNAYDKACETINTLGLDNSVQSDTLVDRGLNMFHKEINAMSFNINGSDFRSVDVLARSQGESSGVYAVNNKI